MHQVFNLSNMRMAGMFHVAVCMSCTVEPPVYVRPAMRDPQPPRSAAPIHGGQSASLQASCRRPGYLHGEPQCLLLLQQT